MATHNAPTDLPPRADISCRNQTDSGAFRRPAAEAQAGPRTFCGLMGVFGSDRAADDIWLGLHALQHRGQESAGIVTSDNGALHCLKDSGLLQQAVPRDKAKSLLPGRFGIGHVRHAGPGMEGQQNIEPLVIGYSSGTVAIAHNGALTNGHALRDEYEAYGAIFQTSTDSELLVHMLAKPTHIIKDDPLGHCLGHLDGAFCFLHLTSDALIAARDPRGFRPLALGRLPGGGWAVASETVAFDALGARCEREILPGEIVTIDAAGLHTRFFHGIAGGGGGHTPTALCMFEHVYFARPDSIVFGVNVHQARYRLGQAVARECPVDADIVVPIPDSGYSAALGYSRESGIPQDRGIVRNHYVGRSFIKARQSQRTLDVTMKHNVVKPVVEGRRLVIVDDSLVHGTTMGILVKSLRDAGAREIHLRLSCPPNLHPCRYGVGFTNQGELLAAKFPAARICADFKLDSIGYCSLEGAKAAMSGQTKNYCDACFTGLYPTGNA